MADEKVNILVKVVTRTKQLDALMAKLRAVEAMEDRLSSGKTLNKYASGTSAALSRATGKWRKHFDYVDKGIQLFGKGLTKFLGAAIKGVLVEMGLLGAAMVAWHALVVAGQYVVKAYHGVMQLLAGGAAAATVAIATATAAIREQQAAMYAYRGKGARQFGSGMNQTMMAMRNLQSDTALASLGVEALNSAFGVMSKTMSSTQINASGKSIKALMDFGAAGQDPKKSVQQVATVVAALNDEKKTISNVMAEAKKLGPEMEKALKDANIKTKAQFKEMLFSGEMAKKGGVLGQFDAVNETLISRLSSYFTQLRGQFADFGEQFLGPAKVAFERLFRTISRDLSRLLLSVQSGFGAEGFIDGFVNGIEKLSGWMVKTIRQYLPAIKGMFERIGNWLKNFKRGWDLVLERLRPLIDGARVIEKAFGGIWEAIKEGAKNMGRFRELLVNNESDVIEFGNRIGDLIRDASDLLFKMKGVFFEILPFLNDVLSGIGMLLRGMTKLLTGLGGGGGGFMKALAPLLAFGIFGKRFQGAAGKLMPTASGFSGTVPQMTVNAGTVNVNGRPAGGPGGGGAAGGAMPSGRLSSGGAGPGGAAPYPYTAYGPAFGAMYTTRQQLGSMPRLHGVDHGAILRDYKYKEENLGPRAMPAGGLYPGIGGMIVGQARYGSTGPTSWAGAGPQLIPSREFVSTSALGQRQDVGDMAYAQAMPRTIIEKNIKGHGRLGYQEVYKDMRAYSGVLQNDRGIAMSYAQASQSPFRGISLDPRMRLGEAMRTGRMLKQGFETGDNFRAGMDQRRFERQEILNRGYGFTPVTGKHTPGMPAATPGILGTTSSKGPDVDYSRLGAKRIMRLARSRGVDTSGGLDATLKAMARQDKDRMLASKIATLKSRSQQRVYEDQLSSEFRSGEYARWHQTVTDPKTGEKRTEIRDPGLTKRESLTKSGMAFSNRVKDVAAVVGNKARGAVGSFQGAMAYANSGRWDASLNDGKGDFVDVNKMRQEAYQRMMYQRGQAVEFDKDTQTWRPAVGEDGKPVGPTGQNRGKFTTKLSYLRERARIARSETKFGAASKRFAQSGTGRMATSMGLGLASQYAPEEMRGAMALGGMVSTIDPRLGLAVAGIGGAMKAKSVGAGALAGAAGGAAIGQMFGPWGAAIGAGIGLLGGGIMGAINKNKDIMKKATRAAQDSINSVFTGVAAAASRTFDLNKEAAAKGVDISKRKAAFGDIASKAVAKRTSMANDLFEIAGLGMQTDQYGRTYRRAGNITRATIEKGNKFGESIKFADTDEGNAAAREIIKAAYDNQDKYGMTITDQMYDDMTKNDGAARNAARRLTAIGGTFDKVMLGMEKTNTKRMGHLEKATGKSAAELEILAQELGVNLYDATTDYMTLVKQLGGAMKKTAAQLNEALMDIFLQSQNRYQKKITAREAQKTIDQASQGYRDKMLDESATDLDKEIATDEYFAQYAQNALALNEGNAFAAYQDTRKAFKDGEVFKEGQVFEGLEGTQAQTQGLAVLGDMRKGLVDTITSEIANTATAAGTELDADKLNQYISKLSETELDALAEYTLKGREGYGGKTAMEFMSGDDKASMDNVLNMLFKEKTLANPSGVDFVKQFGYQEVVAGKEGEADTLNQWVGDTKKLADQMALDYDIFKQAVDLYKTTTGNFFKGEAGGPDWWKTGLIWDSAKGQLRPPDTYSPRGNQIGDTTTSKLSQTMARHQAMDGQLTGKRNVTSSWRNWNLGSSNSDHVTGRAYDLVGQNLGQYAKLVHSNGGFAEFHGNLASRHLHVVPGPVPGVGDTPVPAINTKTVSSANSTASGPGQYTININGANASPEAIANMVMAKLDDRERKYRER